MTDFGRRAGDMLKSVYDTDDDGVVDVVEAAPPHKTSHQSSGDDELNTSGLTGRINYVNRGDPNAWDFQEGDLTKGAPWKNLYLSSIVPTGAQAVHLRLRVKSQAPGNYISFRAKGSARVYNLTTIRTQLGDVPNDGDMHVACDSLQRLLYLLEDVEWDYVQILVRGWYI